MRYAIPFLISIASTASADNFIVCSPSRIEVAVGNVDEWQDGDTYIRLTDEGELIEFESRLCAIETAPPMFTDTNITIGCQDSVSLYKWILSINRVTGEYTKMAMIDPSGAIFTVIGQCELQTSTKF